MEQMNTQGIKFKPPRPIPVILLLDTSGSMAGGKIEELNDAVAEMLASFKSAVQREAVIKVALITFGNGRAVERLPLTESAQIEWDTRFSADGDTPLGAALSKAKELIEDRNIIPSSGLRPMVVLVSDGQPNDAWEAPFDAFLNEGRSQKSNRFAMAIGSDADEQLLAAFASPENPLVHANGAGDIVKFFRKVTMTATGQTNAAQGIPAPAQPANFGQFSQEYL
ncbi:MAG: hypothetical protein Pg6C_11100 [Treponemataceae bacterium]|nr:MAG: hypothetical protein Pg6C_11100 [Treponemataceae bacterium]